MIFKRLAILVLVGCVGIWAVASYRADRAVAPPLDPYGRGEWYYFASEYEAAAAAYHEALRAGLEEPRQKEVRFKVARCYHEGGRFRQAIDAYEDFRRRYPQSDEANRAQGHIEWIRQNKRIE